MPIAACRSVCVVVGDAIVAILRVCILVVILLILQSSATSPTSDAMLETTRLDVPCDVCLAAYPNSKNFVRERSKLGGDVGVTSITNINPPGSLMGGRDEATEMLGQKCSIRQIGERGGEGLWVPSMTPSAYSMICTAQIVGYGHPKSACTSLEPSCCRLGGWVPSRSWRSGSNSGGQAVGLWFRCVEPIVHGP